MKWTITGAGPQNTASIAVSDPGSQWQTKIWHAYVSGTLGAGGTVQVQYSPDPGPNAQGVAIVSDASSRWAAPTALSVTSIGASGTADILFNARFRKARVSFTGGDGTTNLTIEII